MCKIKSAVPRGSIFYCSVKEFCIETILTPSLDNSLALKILEILSEVVFMMLLGPGNFLTLSPNRFPGIWCKTSRC